MWLHIYYEPVAAFGLRPSNTTSTGGKSLLCPTPYAIKMALLDRVIRLAGVEAARTVFTRIRDLTIWLRPPQAVAVNRTFQKVQRNWDGKTGAWTSTIAQREYCFHAGTLTLVTGEILTEEDAGDLAVWFSAINYFGWRGSFMQWVGGYVENTPPEPAAFVNLSVPSAHMLTGGFLQRMDNMRPDARFEDVSVFNSRATGGRISYTVVLPYQLAHHGPNHTVYVRETPV